MPSSVVKSFADKSGKSVAEVEKIWDKLKDEYGEDYQAIVGSLKKILKLNESETKMSFKEYLNSLNESSEIVVDVENEYSDAEEVYNILDDADLDSYKSSLDLKAGLLTLTFKSGLDAKKAQKLLKTVKSQNEAQSQVQKVRGILGKPSSSTLKGNSEKATWKLKDGSTIEVDDAEARIYYMNKNGKDVIDAFTSVGQMKKALFQAGLLNESSEKVSNIFEKKLKLIDYDGDEVKSVSMHGNEYKVVKVISSEEIILKGPKGQESFDIEEILEQDEMVKGLNESEEVQELEEASKVKPFIKKVGKKSWAIKIEALGSDQGFPEYNFGQQIDPSRKVKTWKDGAKKGYVDAKGKATLQAVKDWVKENNPKEFYASWESDSSSYKDDSVEIFYK